MNFLAHLFFSGNDPEILVGNFMGDFVKGRVDDGKPHPLRDGIMLHRRIDSFAEHHPLFLRSRQRLAPRYGLYRGVMVDLFYDHFLAVDWEELSPEHLDDWLVRMRMVVESYRSLLPPRLQGLLPVIFGELIPSYREIAGIGRAFLRMSQRIRRPNPLAGGEEELSLHYAELHDDFRRFLPEALEFSKTFHAASGM